MSDDLFKYTRADAIRDGVLRDITRLAREAGFFFPVAITQGAWAECIAVGRDDVDQDETGRTWDVLICLRHAARQRDREDLIFFHVLVSKAGGPLLPVRLKAQCGPGDDGRPVVTVMLPNED